MWVENWGHLPGQLLVVSGPSGSGKSSIVRLALVRSDLNLQLSISATTRDPRSGEVDGVDYIFMENDEFRAAKDSGKFLETAVYNGRYYGTPAEPVYLALSQGKSVILEIEVAGAEQIRDNAPSSIFLFIKTRTFQILEKRLRTRGTEAEPSILRRLKTARRELAEAHWYDHVLINDELDECVEQFVTLLKSYGRGG